MSFCLNPFTGNLDNNGYSLTTLDSRYVNVTGDTMTGDLIGTDFVSTRGFTITRTDGYVSSIAKTDGRTLVITRDSDDYISSITDSVRIWTLTRDSDSYITSCVVT